MLLVRARRREADDPVELNMADVFRDMDLGFLGDEGWLLFSDVKKTGRENMYRTHGGIDAGVEADAGTVSRGAIRGTCSICRIRLDT